jgi:hypothetical protein
MAQTDMYMYKHIGTNNIYHKTNPNLKPQMKPWLRLKHSWYWEDFNSVR